MEAGWELERELFATGYKLVGGCDEVGRGPLAGPVVAAVAVFDRCALAGLRDSKQLTEARRRTLNREIVSKAVAIGIGVVDNGTIDRINILNATKLAMTKAWRHLSVKAGYLLLDAVVPEALAGQVPLQALVGGDARSASIAAASIVAKVYRDRLMAHYHSQFPQYGFAQNKGYPTAQHLAALRKYGPCPLHRLSFRSVAQ